MQAPSGAALEAPEGAWALAAERRPVALAFHADTAPRLLVVPPAASSGAQASGAQASGELVVLSTLGSAFVYDGALAALEPLLRLDLRPPPPTGGGAPAAGGAQAAHVTALAHCASSADGLDLLVGYSTGEVRAHALRRELTAPPGAAPLASALVHRPPAAAGAGRVVALAVLPGSAGAAVLSVHASGEVLLHSRGGGAAAGAAGAAAAPAAPPPPPARLAPPRAGGAAAAALAPDGARLALAGLEMRLLEIPSGAPCGGFRSYHGGLLCCAWAPGGAAVAAGGEDDMLGVYSPADRAVLARCHGGHSAWVAAAAFDTAAGGGGGGAAGALRLASAGQDGRICLWDAASSTPAAPASPLSPSAAAAPARAQIFDPDDVAVAPPFSEMDLVAPAAAARAHPEPLCDIAFCTAGLLAAAHDGSLKLFARPAAAEVAAAEV
jgi:hypothetical protein